MMDYGGIIAVAAMYCYDFGSGTVAKQDPWPVECYRNNLTPWKILGVVDHKLSLHGPRAGDPSSPAHL